METATPAAAPLKICVAVDGSDNSRRGLAFAINEIYNRARGDELHLLMVQPRSTLLEKLVDPFDVVHVTDSQLRSFAQERIAPFEAICKQNGISDVKASIVLTDAAVQDEICDQMQFLGIDMLVIGARGLSTLERLVLGSVSNYCVQHCECNVCVVR